LNYSHDNISLVLDGYYQSGWKSSDAGSNFMINKNADKMSHFYAGGEAVTTGISWGVAWELTNAGAWTFHPGSALGVYIRDTAIGFNSPSDSNLEVFADGTITLTTGTVYLAATVRATSANNWFGVNDSSNRKGNERQ
jgi:hypothetical protein